MKNNLNPVLCLIGLSLPIVTQAIAAPELRGRQMIEKPAKIKIDRKKHDLQRINVKFQDDFPIRLRKGKMELGAGVEADSREVLFKLLKRLDKIGAKWEREHSIDEEKLREMRETGQKNTGKAMPDLNTAYILRLPTGEEAAPLIDELNALGTVEIALPMPTPSPHPVVPDFQSQQGYLNAAADGIDAQFAWSKAGGSGSGIRICDIEYLWNLSHNDYSATLVGPAPVAPVIGGVTANDDHGTAVLGIMGGRNNGVGVTGIAYGSDFFVTASNTASGYNPAGAITTATTSLRAGDILVLEMQTDGPAAGSMDFVPIEWVASVYNAIVTATANGIIVVEAAGNGGQNLDDAIFNTGHRPFLAANDSGAIIVGAGAPPGHAEGNLARLSFSSYGSTVDLQGWGENVVTTGYGDLHNADGKNNQYTGTFNGTSSATPIVAGACAAIQGAYKASNGNVGVLSPTAIRDILRYTGTAQQAGTNPVTQNIGPRPNLARAIPYVFGNTVWVDFAFTSFPPLITENGTYSRPFNTVSEGVAAVANHGTLIFKTGITPWTGTINKPMKILSFNGVTTIGQ
jgi:serine protease